MLSTHPAIHIVAVVGCPTTNGESRSQNGSKLRDGENVTGEEIIRVVQRQDGLITEAEIDRRNPTRRDATYGGRLQGIASEAARSVRRKQYQEQKQGKVESWGRCDRPAHRVTATQGWGRDPKYATMGELTEKMRAANGAVLWSAKKGLKLKVDGKLNARERLDAAGRELR